MAGKKGYVLHVPGADLRQFENTFCAYVQTGKEASEGIISDYSGSIDPEGRFYITRKGKDASKGLNNEAHLMGSVREDREKNETVIEYFTRMSAVFLACMVILGVFCAGFLTYALIAYFKLDKFGPLLPASFFFIAFVLVLCVSLVRPESRSLEKVLEKIVGEYADIVDPEQTAEDVGKTAEDAGQSAESAGTTEESGERND